LGVSAVVVAARGNPTGSTVSLSTVSTHTRTHLIKSVRADNYAALIVGVLQVLAWTGTWGKLHD